MIFTFYKAQGLSVGSSLVEEDKLDLATSLLKKAKAKGVSLLLPSDVVIADKFAPDANSKVCKLKFYDYLKVPQKLLYSHRLSMIMLKLQVTSEILFCSSADCGCLSHP